MKFDRFGRKAFRQGMGKHRAKSSFQVRSRSNVSVQSSRDIQFRDIERSRQRESKDKMSDSHAPRRRVNGLADRATEISFLSNNRKIALVCPDEKLFSIRYSARNKNWTQSASGRSGESTVNLSNSYVPRSNYVDLQGESYRTT